MNKDFQNGLIVGLASKGKATQKSMSVASGVEVIPPLYAEPLIVETSNNVTVETTVALESEE